MTNNPTIDGVSRELLERLLTDACNENWSDLNELLHAPAACRCRRFGKDNPHWPCPVHSVQVDQHNPTTAMTEAGCQAYMDADGMIGIMHNSSMGHAYVAMRAAPEVADLQSTIAQLQARITQLESEAMYAAAGYQAARDRIVELESGRGEQSAPFYINLEDWNLLVRGDISIANTRVSRAKGGKFTEPLFAAQPAPVAAPEIAQHLEAVIAMFTPLDRACNRTLVEARACLDAAAALNGQAK